MNREKIEHLSKPAIEFARKDIPILNSNWTVGQALEDLRKHNIQERLIYFYLVNNSGQLQGVVPTRQLLGSTVDIPLANIVTSEVITLEADATVYDACKLFTLHKFLAFPIIDQDRHLLGIVDIGFFRDEQLSFAERNQIEDVFQMIGFSLFEIADKSQFEIFRFRFPWLIVTICCGTLCAVLSGVYEETLQKMIVYAFFLTLVGGLSESVSMQSMTIVIQKLHGANPTWPGYLKWIKNEITSSFYLGLASGLLVGTIAYCWKGDLIVSFVMGGSILLSVVCSCLIGFSIPVILHAVHEDSKIAAGPIALAVADLTTIFIYLNAAAFATGNFN